MSTTTIIPSYHTVNGHEFDCSCSFCRAARTARMNLDASADFVLEPRDDTYRVLVIGPMSGEEDWNRPVFEAARQTFIDWYDGDCKVIIPHDLDTSHGLLPGTRADTWSVTPEARAGYLKRTIRLLTQIDAIITLDYWWDSRGASVEALVAAAMGLDFYFFDPSFDEDDFVDGPIARWITTANAVEVAMEGVARHMKDLHGGGISRYQEPTGDFRFHSLLREMGELHDRKQADYGRETDPFANVRASADFGVPAWVGAMVRANDKMRRLQTYAQGSELANESARDSFMDLAVYALIGLILHDEHVGGEW